MRNGVGEFKGDGVGEFKGEALNEAVPQVESACRSEPADLTQYPKDKIDAQGPSITIGDLHGNALKFIYFLAKYNVLKITEEQYNVLQNIYNSKNELTAEDFAQFEDILKNAECDKTKLVRLIGDTLADRGRNDYLTLLVYQCLANKGVDFELLLSNHDMEFFEAYFKSDYNPYLSFLHAPPSPNRPISQVQSLVGLHQSLETNVVNKETIESMVKTVILPRCKLVSCETGHNNVTIYSHAPITVGTVEQLADKFEIEQDCQTVEGTITTVAAINERFLETFNSENFSMLYTDDESFAAASPMADPAKVNNPVLKCIWARKLDPKDARTNKRGYGVSFVHGHTGPGAADIFKSYWNPKKIIDLQGAKYFNLDSYCGREDLKDEIKRGKDALVVYESPKGTLTEVQHKALEIINQLGDFKAKKDVIDSIGNNVNFSRMVPAINIDVNAIVDRLPESPRKKTATNLAPVFKQDVFKALADFYNNKEAQGDANQLRTSIQAAQEKFVGGVDGAPGLADDRTRWSAGRRYFMKAVTNFCSYILVVAVVGIYLHVRHKRKTGNHLFFKSTESMQRVKALDKDIIEEATATPAA